MNPAAAILLGLGLVAAWWYFQQLAPTVALSAGDTSGAGDTTAQPSPVMNLPNAPVQLAPQDAAIVRLVLQLSGDIAPAAVLGVMQIESGDPAGIGGWNPQAFLPDSNGGSFGLMQLDLPAAQQVGYTGAAAGLYDPATNVALGVAYLDWIEGYLTRRLGAAPSEDQWISSYNAGVGNTLRGFIQWSYVTRWRAARDRWTQVLSVGVA